MLLSLAKIPYQGYTFFSNTLADQFYLNWSSQELPKRFFNSFCFPLLFPFPSTTIVFVTCPCEYLALHALVCHVHMVGRGGVHPCMNWNRLCCSGMTLSMWGWLWGFNLRPHTCKTGTLLSPPTILSPLMLPLKLSAVPALTHPAACCFCPSWTFFVFSLDLCQIRTVK